jgi:hypothetical protein
MKEAEKQQNSAGMIGGPEDDLTIRAYLYGVLFQSYADKVGDLLATPLSLIPICCIAGRMGSGTACDG